MSTSGYDVNAHLDPPGGAWFFVLNSVEHRFRQVIRPTSYKTNLLAQAYPLTVSFPRPPGLHPVTGTPWSEQQARFWARNIDLDPQLPVSPGGPQLVPYGTVPQGPQREYFWVRSIAVDHENFHLIDFYTGPWMTAMGEFEQDIEEEYLGLEFDCSDTPTTTAAGAEERMRQAWGNDKAVLRHGEAFAAFGSVDAFETRAHTSTNPKYVPIRTGIAAVP